MITRKRGRIIEALKSEGNDCLTIERCEVEKTEDVHTSYGDFSPESEDGSGLDLDEFLTLDDENWSLDNDAISTLFDLGEDAPEDGVTAFDVDRSTAMDTLASHMKLGGALQRKAKRAEVLPGHLNKNALAARMNRLRKKEYVNGLEKKVSTLVSENSNLKQENLQLNKRVEELEDETRYLRAVLANQSVLARLLSRLSGVNGVKLSTSLFQEADRNDHDYALPNKRMKLEEKETSGGVCLHVDKDHVSVEFCTKCAESASASLKM